MGADTFYIYYGVAKRIHLGSPEIGQLEDDSHPIYSLAFEHKLHATWGVPWEDQPAFLLIGTQIGVFGAENATEGTTKDSEMEEIRRKTRERLKAAGIEGEPQMHYHFQLDY